MQSIALIPRAEVEKVARSWIGVPYRHQGRSRRAGVDCIGLILVVAKDLGLDVPLLPTNYTASPNSKVLFDNAQIHLVPTPDDTRMWYGGIAILYGFARGEAQHFAINGAHNGRLTMIHAFQRRGEVCEHSVDVFWTKRFVKSYDMPRIAPFTAFGV